MKKNVLALSITAALVGLTGGAHAMTNLGGASATVSEFNGGGPGHKLIVPYFSTQNNNNTLLNIINTDLANGKAVKVRFRGAANSDDIFDFQVFLSPGDVWTAQINQGLDGISRLTTNDLSCTKPSKNVLNNVSFVTERLDGTMTEAQKANGTHEGYIEILNMADIPKTARAATGPVADVANSATAGIGAGNNPLFTAIKHPALGAPPCASATAPGTAASSAAWAFLDDNNLTYDAVAPAITTPANAGLLPPTTGLMANWTIINVVGAAAFSGEAIAVENRDLAGFQATSPTLGTVAAAATERVNLGNVVYWPQTAGAVDTTASGSTEAEKFTADALFRTANVFSAGSATGQTAVTTAAIAAKYYDLPDLSTPYNKTATSPLQQAVALSGSLATKSVRNEFITDRVISATTDWTFSQPTRRYSVAFNYNFPATTPTTDDGRRFTDIFGNTFATAYYAPVNTFAKTDISTVSGTNGNGRQICVSAPNSGIKSTTYDREENIEILGTPVVISPQTPGKITKLEFCGEASVLSFNNGGIRAGGTGSLKASVAVQDIDVKYGDGWTTITTPAAAGALIGLPVVGSAYVRAVGSSGGQTFGAEYQHRLQR